MIVFIVFILIIVIVLKINSSKIKGSIGEAKVNTRLNFIGKEYIVLKDILIKKLGILGEELYNHANGIDNTDIREKYDPVNKNLSVGQVLLRDYTFKEAKLIIKEMNDDLCSRMRSFNLETQVIHLMIGYSTCSQAVGFAHQIQLLLPTSNNNKIYDALMYLYNSYVNDEPIRRIGISFSKLTKKQDIQLSLFDNYEKDEKESKLFDAMDAI